MPQPLPKGARDRARGTSTLASLQFCACGGANQSGPLAIVQRSRPRRTQFGTISGLALFYCAVCAGQCRLGTRVFAPPGLFPLWGLRPFGVLFLPQCACFRRAASCHAVVQRQPIPSSTHPHRARLARARCAVPRHHNLELVASVRVPRVFVRVWVKPSRRLLPSPRFRDWAVVLV